MVLAFVADWLVAVFSHELPNLSKKLILGFKGHLDWPSGQLESQLKSPKTLKRPTP